MSEQQKSRFEKLLNLGSDRMLSALGAYHIWKWMELARNINSPGGETTVNRNLAIMNRHGIFFAQLGKSTYKSFVADLSIFFDKDGYDGTFSMKKLLASTCDKFTAAEVETLRKELEKIKYKQGANIKFLHELRNADVAHQEIDSRARHLLYANVESLFGAVQEMLNLISNRYDKSVHWWEHVEKEANRQMKWVFDNLERGEAARLKEIKEKWQE
jgi:hypothetical protein